MGVFLLCKNLIASDAITIDSIFKNAQGLRSISTLSFIASGGNQKFTSYPALVGIDDGEVLVDTKILSLNETLLYAYNSKLDFMLSVNSSYQSLQYLSQSGFKSKDTKKLSSFMDRS